MKKPLAVLMLSLMLFSMFAVLPVSADVGWLTGWVYRKQINVTPSAGAGINYTVHLTVYWSNGVDSDGKAYVNQHCQADFGDLRFTDYDGVTLIPFWINSYVSGVSADIWVKTPMNLSSSNATVYLYYGNPAVETISDSASTFQRVISSGVVLSLPMDEGSGSTVYDYSDYDNNGTIYGASWVDGKYGKALSFNGTSDYVTVLDSISLRTTTNWAKTFWIYSNVPLIGNGKLNDVWIQRTTTNKFLFRIDPAGKWSIYYYSTGGAFSSTDVAKYYQTWTHIAVVKSNTTLTIYENGSVVSTLNNAESEPNDSHLLFLGAYNGVAQFFHGIIDDARIYNRALTQEEITDSYNFYPQVFLNHLGSVYLRSYVSPEPVAYPLSESAERYATKGEFLGAAVVIGFICVMLLLALLLILRRR